MDRPYPAGRRSHARIASVDGFDENDFCEVVVTADDADWLAAFTRTLVEERLAACGHTVAAVRSIYRWQGSVHDEPEARVALHTRRSLVPAIVARADELHPYDVPCVLALPVVGGNPAYLAWIDAETRGSSPHP
jgi:periplasmic divalent cation tolerance protein